MESQSKPSKKLSSLGLRVFAQRNVCVSLKPFSDLFLYRFPSQRESAG